MSRAGLIFGFCQCFSVFVGKKRIQGNCLGKYAGPVPMTLNSLVMKAMRLVMVLFLNLKGA